MVRELIFNEIQAHKQMGYSQNKVAKVTGLDRKTVKKYWNMPQEEYSQYLSKCSRRAKQLDCYKQEIIQLLETWANITSAIIYDRLRENHADFRISGAS
jgi:transposase